MLDRAGVVSNDQAVTCFVHQGVSDQSTQRYHQAAAMERDLIQLMQEQAPDQEVGGPPLDLHLQATTSALKRDGHSQALPLRVQNCLQSISRDSNQLMGNDPANGNRPTPEARQGSIRVRSAGKDTIQVSLRQEWSQVAEKAQQRRDNAGRILRFLLNLLPQGARGKDLLVTTTRGALTEALSQAALPLGTGNNPQPPVQGGQQSWQRGHDQKLDAAILWLHQQEIIRLNQGMGIFTPAMTIRMERNKGTFTEADYQPLQQYYDTQTVQIHIMAEYARQGLESATAAVRLTMDYFSMEQEGFLKKWLPNQEAELKRQTSQDSYRKIVTDLNHRTQQAIVSDNRVETNVLIMAGPGAGKTRVLVHRIAYLVRCCRERPESIIALAYNRHAAVEIRQRLQELIGDDARGVLVMTLHSLAMSLTGETFTQTGQQNAFSGEAGAEDTNNDNPDRYFRSMLGTGCCPPRGQQRKRPRRGRRRLGTRPSTGPPAGQIPLDIGGRIPGYERVAVPAYHRPQRPHQDRPEPKTYHVGRWRRRPEHLFLPGSQHRIHPALRTGVQRPSKLPYGELPLHQGHYQRSQSRHRAGKGPNEG